MLDFLNTSKLSSTKRFKFLSVDKLARRSFALEKYIYIFFNYMMNFKFRVMVLNYEGSASSNHLYLFIFKNVALCARLLLEFYFFFIFYEFYINIIRLNLTSMTLQVKKTT